MNASRKSYPRTGERQTSFGANTRLGISSAFGLLSNRDARYRAAHHRVLLHVRTGGSLVERSGNLPRARSASKATRRRKRGKSAWRSLSPAVTSRCPDHFRVHVDEKVARLERYDHQIVGLEVELFHEPNRRQSKSCQRVEITGRGGRRAVARAEACAQDFYAALDAAVAKLEGRLRRSHDRRRVTGRRARVSAARAGTAAARRAADREFDAMIAAPKSRTRIRDRRRHSRTARPRREPARRTSPSPVAWSRRKVHTAEPDERRRRAVPHGAGRTRLLPVRRRRERRSPSVVYRRKGYDYGVIRLARIAATVRPVHRQGRQPARTGNGDRPCRRCTR